MADGNKQRNDNAGNARVNEMTVAQIKEELRGRKLKVTGNKVNLVTRLKVALVLEDQHKEESNYDRSSNESEDEQNGADTHDVGRNKAHNRLKFVPTFKDVEELIDVFNDNDGKNVNP